MSKGLPPLLLPKRSSNLSQNEVQRLSDSEPLTIAPSCPSRIFNISDSVVMKDVLSSTSSFHEKNSYASSFDSNNLPPEISKLPLSEAKELLYSFRFSGWLNKKGFKWLKRWKNRYVVLAGRMLSYFDVYFFIIYNIETIR